jgi:ERF superfamily
MSKDMEIAVVQEPVALTASQGGQAVAPRTLGGSMNELLFMAVERGTSVAELKELVALHQEMAENQAKKDLAQALAAFQATTPSIKHNKSGGKMSYTYASLDEIATTVVPEMAKHGLSFTHDARVANGIISCTCTVHHFAGATTTASIDLPTSSNSAASDQQKINAALTFARRLTLSMALGLTTTDEDRDGRDDHVAVINEEQATTLAALAEEVNVNMPRFLAYLGVDTLNQCPVSKYADAVRTLEKRRSAK